MATVFSLSGRSCALSRNRSIPISRWACCGLGIVLAVLAWRQPANACDLCAIYTATESQAGRTGLRLGVAEQFTRFTTLLDGGKSITNEGERMYSSITQLMAGYNFTETFGLQLNLPIISRSFRRFEDGELRKGDETGLGDAALLAMYSPLRWSEGNFILRFTMLGGIKIPTGKTGRLREERDEAPNAVPQFPDVPGRGLPGVFLSAERSGGRSGRTSREHSEGEQASGIHGHDLALGSGSVDGILGMRFFATWKRLYAAGSLQYFLRTQGRFKYRFANELLWTIGPGFYLTVDDVALERGYTLALAAQLNGETKGQDRIAGALLDDTAVTALYLGPALLFTWGQSLQVSLGGELPVLQKNTAIQILPDFRVRAALTYRF